MSEIKVTFDFKNNIASFEYLNKKFESKILLEKSNNWTDMVSVSYSFNKDYKWVFTWEIWAEKEQFVTFSEYDKNRLWTDFAKWSHISKPSLGTLQTNKVYRLFYKKHFFPNVNNISINIIGSKYGDFNNNNYVEGYFY